MRVRGNTIVPATVFGRFAILCAILRQLHLVLSIAVFSYELDHLKPTHFFVDQLSACVPLLRYLYTNVGILFYCHFPDQALAQKGHGAIAVLKKAYRVPFNSIESWSTASSHAIVVNSNFTGGVVKRILSRLSTRPLKVVYPCVDISGADKMQRKSMWPGRKVILSINRFEKKKDVALAVKAFASLDASVRKSALLVIAGIFHKHTFLLSWLTRHRRLRSSRPRECQHPQRITTTDRFLLPVPRDPQVAP